MKKIIIAALLCLVCAATAYAEGNKEVARATFATAIENREPVESISEYYPAEGASVFFFTELKNMQDTQVTHVWNKNGEEAHSITFNVKGARWRVNSSMKAAHFKSGDKVQVEVMGDDGTIYETVTLDIR
ncbi:DUF2914 domain-containing protein [Desulfovibrio sp. OttesenSCG-928-F07]|nr:DUF2914 domain-containing protein [Desulfovibrio sp. OttesenSCG-928-F07]